jgi:hypothetical protein
MTGDPLAPLPCVLVRICPWCCIGECSAAEGFADATAPALSATSLCKKLRRLLINFLSRTAFDGQDRCHGMVSARKAARHAAAATYVARGLAALDSERKRTGMAVSAKRVYWRVVVKLSLDVRLLTSERLAHRQVRPEIRDLLGKEGTLLRHRAATGEGKISLIATAMTRIGMRSSTGLERASLRGFVTHRGLHCHMVMMSSMRRHRGGRLGEGRSHPAIHITNRSEP